MPWCWLQYGTRDRRLYRRPHSFSLILVTRAGQWKNSSATTIRHTMISYILLTNSWIEKLQLPKVNKRIPLHGRGLAPFQQGQYIKSYAWLDIMQLPHSDKSSRWKKSFSAHSDFHYNIIWYQFHHWYISYFKRIFIGLKLISIACNTLIIMNISRHDTIDDIILFGA